MSVNYEFESRAMLSKEVYNSLISFYINSSNEYSHFVNTNYYFDTNEMTLLKNKTILRLRAIDNSKFELTLKISEKNKAKEITDQVTRDEKDNIINRIIIPNGDVKNELNKYNVSSLKLLTKLTTERYEISTNSNIICLDKNEYNGIIDFNIEVESTSKENAFNILK